MQKIKENKETFGALASVLTMAKNTADSFFFLYNFITVIECHCSNVCKLRCWLGCVRRKDKKFRNIRMSNVCCQMNNSQHQWSKISHILCEERGHCKSSTPSLQRRTRETCSAAKLPSSHLEEKIAAWKWCWCSQPCRIGLEVGGARWGMGKIF